MSYPFEERIAQLETMKREMRDLWLTDFQKTFGEHPGSYPELLKCLQKIGGHVSKTLEEMHRANSMAQWCAAKKKQLGE